MAKRFDGSQQALDLNNIQIDPGKYSLIQYSTGMVGINSKPISSTPMSDCVFPVFTDLVSQNIDVALNRKNSMQAIIKIIEENIPEVRRNRMSSI